MVLLCFFFVVFYRFFFNLVLQGFTGFRAYRREDSFAEGAVESNNLI